jgi:hypothetical protein
VPRTPKPTYHIVGLVRDAKFLQVREERTNVAVRFSSNQSSAMFLPIAYLAVAQEMVPAPPDLELLMAVPSVATAGGTAFTHHWPRLRNAIVSALQPQNCAPCRSPEFLAPTRYVYSTEMRVRFRTRRRTPNQ